MKAESDNMTEDSLHTERIVGHCPINELSFLISHNGTYISTELKKIMSYMSSDHRYEDRCIVFMPNQSHMGQERNWDRGWAFTAIRNRLVDGRIIAHHILLLLIIIMIIIYKWKWSIWAICLEGGRKRALWLNPAHPKWTHEYFKRMQITTSVS